MRLKQLVSINYMDDLCSVKVHGIGIVCKKIATKIVSICNVKTFLPQITKHLVLGHVVNRIVTNSLCITFKLMFGGNLRIKVLCVERLSVLLFLLLEDCFWIYVNICKFINEIKKKVASLIKSTILTTFRHAGLN